MNIIASIITRTVLCNEKSFNRATNIFSNVVLSVDDTIPRTLVLSMIFDNKNMKPGQKVTAVL